MVQRRGPGVATLVCCATVAALFVAPPGTAAPSPEPEGSVAWIDATRVDLASLDPDEPTSDLEALSGWVREAAVVGVGDGSHGTHEFYTVKHRLIRHMVERVGTRTILFEGPWPEFNRINDYVQGRTRALAPSLESEWWFWNTGEIVELIEWVREWNLGRSAEDRVEFRGVDMAIPRSLIEDVSTYLGAGEARALDCFRDYTSYSKLAASRQAACRMRLAGMREAIGKTAAGGSRRAQEVRASADMILQAELLYRETPRYDFGPRDAMIASNVMSIRAARPEQGPIVFWAHNGHVGSGTIPFHDDQRSVGSYLTEAYGDRYFSIGTLTARGDFLAWDSSSTWPLRRVRYPRPEDRSYESLLGRAQSDSFLLDTRGDRAKELLGRRTLSFGMGGPSVQRPVVELTDLFDAVIFIRNTTPSDYRKLADHERGPTAATAGGEARSTTVDAEIGAARAATAIGPERAVGASPRSAGN